jgi:peptidoglycan/LPS O-acetylase OafA/YrhL
LKYRAEIDGLRALAVVPVILFHAGSELFSGGFVGVDVFFVISGYLITTILIDDIEKKRFSIVNFYERRARRILPALFFVMLVCIPFAWMWMLPNQIKDFSQSLVAVSLFASNILFWQESGYFDAAAEEKPLLHTWSLAVEEQYYILFPIFLILAWRFGKDRVFWMIVIMAAISLMLSEWGWRNKATANFYLAPTRAWELFAGSIAAFIVLKNGVQKNNVLALLGLAAIIFSIFEYDEKTPFPSVYALVPVLGVVLLIIYADKETLAAKLLSTRPFVGIGLISYSAYLWHQPLLAFARIQHTDLDLTGLGMPHNNIELEVIVIVPCIVATFLLAYISWKFIEKPFRTPNVIKLRFIPKWYVNASLGLTIFIFIGLYEHFSMNGPQLKNDVQLSTTWSEDVRQFSCLLQEPEQSIHADECLQNPHSVVLWGDSHAASLSPGVRQIIEELDFGFTQFTQSGCAPLSNLEDLDYRTNCNSVNSHVLKKIIDSNFHNVVLHAGWLHENYPLNADEIIEKLNSIIQTLKTNMPSTNIVIVGAVPRWQLDPRFHFVTTETEKYLFSDTALLLGDINGLLDHFAQEQNVKFVNPTEIFCPNYQGDRNCILAIRDVNLERWTGVAIDYGHLSIDASLLLAHEVISKLVLP